MNLASYGVAGQVLERDLKDQGGRGLFSGQEPEFTFSIFFLRESKAAQSCLGGQEDILPWRNRRVIRRVSS